MLMLSARVSLLALGFGNAVLTARLLQPEGRGAYATIMAALTLFTLSIGSIAQSVALSAAHDDVAERNRTTSASIGLALSAGLLPILLLLVWHPGGGWFGPALVAAGSTPLVLITSSVQFASLGRGRLGWVAALQIVQPALLVLLGVALMVRLHAGLVGAMLAWTLSWLFTAGIGAHVLVVLGWRLRLAELAPWRSKMLVRFGSGAAVYSTLTYFTNRMLLFLVQGTLGLGAAGVFSVAVTLAEPVSNMSAALSAAAYPRLVSAAARPREARRFFQLAFLMSIVVSAGTLGLALAFMVPVFGGAYRLAVLPLPLLLLAYVVMSGREIAALWYVHEQKSYWVPIRASMMAFVVTLGLALPLTLRFGTVGTATGAVAGGAVLMTILLVGLRRRGFVLKSLAVPNRSLLGPLVGLADRYGPRRLAAWLNALSPTDP
jgi:O-antigen/teichoic acid export membrane protein